LGGIRDIERLVGRLTLAAAGPRDLRSLCNSLQFLPAIKEYLTKKTSAKLVNIAEGWDNLEDIEGDIDKFISESPPFTIRDSGIIKDGVDEELDSLREILRDGKKWINEIEARERSALGISTLKIKFNNVFGYFIEVSRRESDKVPETYIRKQTLVNAERYISPELKEYEEKALSAEERIKAIELFLFEEVRGRVVAEGKRIREMGAIVGELDVLVSLAEVATRYGYVKPDMDDSNVIDIKDGWHPILDLLPSGERFVPNDTFLDPVSEQIMIITGPNMAGKSTYIRQVALIVLMAQVGSFVPAASARLGLVDRIFTRVGAQDMLYKGQSTFMVEMNETANILNNATDRSLIILDEIGRGTSTFDGISIAWAVVEHIHDKLGAKTLFATHYHELTELRLSMDRVLNYSIAVREWNDELIFLRKIIKGEVDKSYGIQVARLAGLPKEVIERAREILSNLENKEFDESGSPKIAEKKGKVSEKHEPVLPLFSTDSRVSDELKKLNIENITPLDALTRLAELKRLVED
ncbi:MAG: DNA mismatch repair protein MutS, partial [Nitrospinota bacterium]